MTFSYQVGVVKRQRHLAGTVLQCETVEKAGFLKIGFLLGNKGHLRSLPPVSDRRESFEMTGALCPSSSCVFTCRAGHLHFLHHYVNHC